MKNELIEITATGSLVERRVTFYRRNRGPRRYRNLTFTSAKRVEDLLNDRRDECNIIFTPLALLVMWYRGGV